LLFKAVVTVTPYHQNMAQFRQVGAQAFGHAGVIETPEVFGHDQKMTAGVAEHEAQFAFPKDRHQRVEHRADTGTGQEQGCHLPAVGQLAGHHTAFFHTQGGQAGTHAGDHGIQFAVGKRDRIVLASLVARQARRPWPRATCIPQ
jgi:hypothetical protein